MEFASVTELYSKISADLTRDQSKKSIGLLYAFNATGKTRLALELDNLNDNEEGKHMVLSYNALLEDCFSWDNENNIYKIEPNAWFSQVIIDQGLEGQIADNFKTITNSNIEPSFNFATGEITFSIASGDDTAESNIKVSRGEESVFVWCVFYSILEIAIEALNTEAGSRTTEYFNDVKFVVVDDPVSSIDDARIIGVAVKLFQTVKASTNPQLNFFITTHHALFYNILHNSLSKGIKNEQANKFFYLLSKNIDNTLKLENHNSDSPFAYHLAIKNVLAKAIDDGYIVKYHFNLFRGLLEKTANFLGYTNWSDCIEGDRKIELVRILNHYSHAKISELESSAISETDKQLFEEAFTMFIRDFRYNN